MTSSASGLVVKSNVAIVGPRVRFTAGASFFIPKINNFEVEGTYLVMHFIASCSNNET